MKDISTQKIKSLSNLSLGFEEILDCFVDVEIRDVNVIKTPTGTSQEGQKLTGYKAVIEGYLLRKIEYIAEEPTSIIIL